MCADLTLRARCQTERLSALSTGEYWLYTVFLWRSSQINLFAWLWPLRNSCRRTSQLRWLLAIYTSSETTAGEASPKLLANLDPGASITSMVWGLFQAVPE